MSHVTIRVSNTVGIDIGDGAAITGKNGFTTQLGRIPLLCNSVSIVDVSDSDTGNIQFNIVGLDSLFDENFNLPLLQTNDNVLRGFDYIGIPINQFNNTGSDYGFIGYNPTLTNYSANIVYEDTPNNILKVKNEDNNGAALSDLLPSAPFYVTLSQILDPRFFTSNSIYVTGSYTQYEQMYNVYSNSGIYSANLSIIPRYKESIKVFIDGIEQSISTFDWTLGTNYVNVIIGSGTQQVRTLVDHYNVPIIEVGDNISVSADNTYSVINTSYSVESPNFNVELTANSIYRIYTSESIRANYVAAVAVNISPDLIGTIETVNNNTFSIEHDESITGSFNLANYKVYSLNIPLNFDPITFDKNLVINNAPLGVNMIRARNVNTMGRRSPWSTKSVVVSPLPIQKVQNLQITESLYKDTNQGILVRATISFDAIIDQEVLNYEISYQITQENDIGALNTVVVGNNAIGEDGKIRYTINNIERGRASGVTNLLVRVIAFNNEIHGIPVEITQSISGKTTPPLNIVELSGGQQGNNLLFQWKVPTNADGSVVDIDLNEIVIKKYPGILSVSEGDIKWTEAQQIAKIATPASLAIIPISEYGTHTYLFKTKDTSKNEATSVVVLAVTTVRPGDVFVYKAWSEDSPGVPVVTTLINENATEFFYPSFANSVTGGIAVVGGTRVDNANGSSLGFSAAVDQTDLVALDNAFYTTQVRDVGNLIRATLYVTANGSQTTGITFNNLRQIYATSVSDAGSDPTVLVDADLGGIGTVLGFNNVLAAPSTYDANLRTLISGGSSGNVWAIWNPSQFAGDFANSNSFALIAGIINANAIQLGNTYYSNSVSTDSNDFSNVTTVSSTYELVNLLQFTDPDADLTFQGISGAVTTNLEVRYANINVFYANGNVATNNFINFAINDGWEPYSPTLKQFRQFQLRLSVNHQNPTNTDFTLDRFYYTLELERKRFTTNVITGVGGWANNINYSNVGFIVPPIITVTAFNSTLAANIPFIQTSNVNSANIRTVSAAATGTPGVNVFFVAEGI